MSVAELRTERLLMRRWRAEDRAPFAALNAEPVVMEHFLAPLAATESDALVDRIEAGLEERGWGLWAVEVQDSHPFVGFVGLNPATFDAPFTPAIEVDGAWRPSTGAAGTPPREHVLQSNSASSTSSSTRSFRSPRMPTRAHAASWNGWACATTRPTTSTTRTSPRATHTARTSSTGSTGRRGPNRSRGDVGGSPS